MRKYEDCWVVDRTMFEYVNQVSETDDEKKEQYSPWPTFIHEEILTERARLRVAMKAEMSKYKSFVDTHMKSFMAWWSRLGENAKTRLFQLPGDEVINYFRGHVKVKGSYEILLCAVMEQIRHFQDTGYTDGRVGAELFFEKNLLHKRESFVLDSQYLAMEVGDTNFFEMLQILAGPKLLPVRMTRDQNEKSEAEAEQAKSVSNVQSFRSDRRLVRLVICRIFADMAIRKYMREVVNADGTTQE
ncbi:hypothetical protein BBO99_00002371 [Phytophthora kernoviae]|uniref:Uncharacterized protein n=2 Tax=Phytophthora kernoviae TaxID=325452 RepID=A0A3R7JA81_9STRA|nr:hypothetical protein G195_002865 [Phytophthora kernoviae 00238/432]KAG2529526.1 hypothetical protein JM16_002044 [Phytophthora kernoviae]KAG2530442.1 hypothetical protein JM18_002149 [Phytophthora kernoviae]RLN31297.1 hypothetical protein BBI17_002257 [Phytophthora kernoviae]RLN83148.1 hypothetical protein BBO99_00002371 [Phytophthora kernoviae]